MSTDKTPTRQTGSAVSEFLAKVADTPVKKDGDPDPVGRLLFTMDATASREPTWDKACHLQGQMFQATAGIGSLAVQLCYYRGFNEFKFSPWCSSAADLTSEMTAVRCLGGYTQIHRILGHAMKEHRSRRIRAAVFVGDAIEEDADQLCHRAGQMGVLGIPLFVFQEGHDQRAESVFKQMAQLSGGAYAPFDLASAQQLKDLLAAVAIFATGGHKALTLENKNQAAKLLVHQIKKQG